MTEPKLPTQKELLRPTLLALEKLGGAATRSELVDRALEEANITEDQLNVVFSEGRAQGSPKVITRIHFAISSLKKVGAIFNSERGIWSITLKGRGYLDKEAVEEEKALNIAVKENRTESGERDEDGNENEREEYNEWKNSILNSLKNMSPKAFERLSMRILKEAGFSDVKVTGGPKDGGIDGVGTYKVSLVSFLMYFQCKRYSGNVPPAVIRDFRGAMSGRSEKGIIITTGTFTPEAKKEATRDGVPPIDLVDGEQLCDLLVNYKIGVQVKERTVKDIEVDDEFFRNL